MSAGYTPENYQKLDFEQDSVFESLYFLNKKISVENMKKSGGRAFSKSGLRAYFQNQRILKYQLQRRSNDGK